MWWAWLLAAAELDSSYSCGTRCPTVVCKLQMCLRVAALPRLLGKPSPGSDPPFCSPLRQRPDVGLCLAQCPATRRGCGDGCAQEWEPRAAEGSSRSFGGDRSAWLPAALCGMARVAGSFLLGVAGLLLPFAEKALCQRLKMARFLPPPLLEGRLQG